MSRKNRRKNNEELEVEYKDSIIVEKNETEDHTNDLYDDEFDEIENSQPITNPPMSITLKDNSFIKVEPIKDSRTYIYKELCETEKKLCYQKTSCALACIKKGTVLDNVICIGDGWYRIENGYVYNGDPEEIPYHMTKYGYTSRI